MELNDIRELKNRCISHRKSKILKVFDYTSAIKKINEEYNYIKNNESEIVKKLLQTKKLLKNKDNKWQTDLKYSKKNEKNINKKNLNVKKDNRPLYYILENGPKIRLDTILTLDVGYTSSIYDYDEYYKRYYRDKFYPAFKIMQNDNNVVSFKYIIFNIYFSNVSDAISYGQKQCKIMSSLCKLEWKIIKNKSFGFMEYL